MAGLHGPLQIAETAPNVWAGTLTFTTSGAAGSENSSALTDANFSSQIIRATSKIIFSAANSSAGRIVGNGGAGNVGVFMDMTNNASIIVQYTSAGAGETPHFYFMVFNGGTDT